VKIKLLAISQVTFLALLSFACTQRPFDRSTGSWGHMMGYGGYGGILMWLILIIIAGVIIYFVFARSKRDQKSDKPARETALEILKKRYARGEITKEEFDRLKNDIET
jgi:putative membrane protein